MIISANSCPENWQCYYAFHSALQRLLLDIFASLDIRPPIRAHRRWILLLTLFRTLHILHIVMHLVSSFLQSETIDKATNIESKIWQKFVNIFRIGFPKATSPGMERIFDDAEVPLDFEFLLIKSKISKGDQSIALIFWCYVFFWY